MKIISKQKYFKNPCEKKPQHKHVQVLRLCNDDIIEYQFLGFPIFSEYLGIFNPNKVEE